MKENITVFFGANYPKEGLAGVSRIQDTFKYIKRHEKHLISPGKEKLYKDKVFEKIYIVGQHHRGLSIRSLLVNTHFMINAIVCFLRNNRKYRYRAIYVTSPPFFPVLPAVICGKITGIPVIVDVRDPWAEDLAYMGVFPSGSLFFKIVSMLERFGYNNAKHVTVVTPGLGKLIHEEFGIPEEKISIILNAADTEVFKPHNKLKARKALGLPTTGTILMYQGSFATYHDLPKLAKTFFEYIAINRKKGMYLLLVGKPKKLDKTKGEVLIQLDRVIMENKPFKQNLIIIEEISKEKVPHYLSAADIGIVPLKRGTLSQYSIPLKLYEYAACGKPILFFGNSVEARNLIEKYNIGVMTTNKSVRSFQAAIKTLIIYHKTFSKNALKMSKEINRKNSAKLLEKVIINLSKKQDEFTPWFNLRFKEIPQTFHHIFGLSNAAPKQLCFAFPFFAKQ